MSTKAVLLRSLRNAAVALCALAGASVWAQSAGGGAAAGRGAEPPGAAQARTAVESWLKGRYKVDEVRRTPVAGIWEVRLGNDLIYVDEKGQYAFIEGNLVDMRNQRNLTRERIDELVASQLWIEVRTFKWRRLRKVAANILINTRVGVLREVGDFFYVSRADRTWANTTLVESFASGDLTGIDGGVGYSAEMPTERVAGALFHRPEILADAGPEQEEPSATEELLELLAWAGDHKGISPADRYLLLCLVEAADRVETRRLARGYGGLLSNEVSSRVAPRIGVSEATVRRHGSRTMRALAAAAPRKFGHDE